VTKFEADERPGGRNDYPVGSHWEQPYSNAGMRVFVPAFHEPFPGMKTGRDFQVKAIAARFAFIPESWTHRYTRA
jgi:hypothetical protein